MGKPFVLLAAALGLLRIVSPARAQENVPPAPPKPSFAAVAPNPGTSAAANRIVGYTAWDDDFLYLSFQINKPTLNGKNAAPYSHPLEDDAVIVSLQTDNDHTSTKPTAKTVRIVVSGMGGAQLYYGAEETPLFASFDDIGLQLEAIGRNEPDPEKQKAQRAALLAKLLKFQVTPKGAPRVTGTTLPGYTVEIAIPWVNLGGRPEPETKFGFHVAVQSTTPDSPALQSLSSAVTNAETLKNPSLWGEIEFSNAPVALAANRLRAPRILGAKPNIDGALTEGEWLPLSGFEFGERALTNRAGVTSTLGARVRPEFKPQPPRPAVPHLHKSEPRAMPARKPQKVAALTLARYDMDYQADPRQSVPTEGVWRENNATALANHPLEGTGPWFSYTRADWHRRQLLDVRRAGVDAILTSYRPQPNQNRASDRGLLALAAALNSLRQAGQDYPQVALSLDTAAFVESPSSLPDLTAAATQEVLYAAIRDFFQRIPAAFHLTVPLSKENGGRRACVVFLSKASAFRALDSAFAAYVRGRFAQDFGNTDLILLGGSDFKGKAALDGYFTEAKEKGFQFEGDGWIKTASVSAGYDPSIVEKNDTPRRARRGGEAYRDDWTAALDKRPDWILLEGWNDYARGAAIAPTVEAGYGPADLTRVYTRLFAGLAKRGVKFLWHDAPAALLTNRDYAVNVRAQNTGIEGWDTSGAPGMLPIGIAYRWLKEGQVVATGTAPNFPASVLAGQNVTAALSIKTQGLASGDYVLEIGAAQVDKSGKVASWVSNSGDGSLLEIPIHVSDKAGEALSEWAATLVSSDMPLTPETGSVYEVRAILRNDGTTTWRKAEGARVTARLFQAFAPVGTGETKPETPVLIADATALLESDVAPGQVAAVRLLLPLLDPEGKALPVSDPKGEWSYALCLEIAADGKEAGTVLVANGGGKAETATGVLVAPQTLHITDFDFGVRFLSDGTPATLPGQRRQPVQIGLQNTGPQTWKKDQVRVGYHWYYLDGTEFLWEDETTPLTEDIAPGKSVKDMLAWVTAPPFDGTYYLVWDVKVGETWASTTDSARVFNESVRAVNVVAGKLVFADLTKLYNVDGISDEDDPTDGNFDGNGRTFPASLLPPFADAPIAPAGLWQATSRSGPDSPRRISFRLGSKGPKANNFIACKGQRIELGKSAAQCKTLHILAASSGKDITTNIRLIFQEPSSESEDLLVFSVNKWDAPPARPEQQGYTVRRVHTPQGSVPGAVGLHHYVITVREPRKLVALQLPNEPDIKIAALTLEK